jgi:hypothetical protein
MASHDDAVSALGDALELQAICERSGQGLLDEHVFAGFQSQSCEPGVAFRRRRDYHGVNAVSKHVIEMLCGHFDAEFGGDL